MRLTIIETNALHFNFLIPASSSFCERVRISAFCKLKRFSHILNGVGLFNLSLGDAVRIGTTVIFHLTGYVLIGLGEGVWKLVGVSFTAIAECVGEMKFLALTVFYQQGVIAICVGSGLSIILSNAYCIGRCMQIYALELNPFTGAKVAHRLYYQ